MQLLAILLVVQAVFAALLLIAQTFVLIKIKKHNRFVIMIVLLLFISNLATIIVAVSIRGLIKEQSYYVWLWINGLSLAVLGSAHSVAYWLFAWEYYKIATLMPFALKNDDLPYSIEER